MAEKDKKRRQKTSCCNCLSFAYTDTKNKRNYLVWSAEPVQQDKKCKTELRYEYVKGTA